MDTRPLAEVRKDLSRFVEQAVTTHARLDITRNGKRAAVLLSAEDYDTMQETLDVLSDPVLLADIRVALSGVGGVSTHGEILSDLAARREAHR